MFYNNTDSFLNHILASLEARKHTQNDIIRQVERVQAWRTAVDES
jgi:hypothetical protein